MLNDLAFRAITSGTVILIEPCIIAEIKENGHAEGGGDRGRLH